MPRVSVLKLFIYLQHRRDIAADDLKRLGHEKRR